MLNVLSIETSIGKCSVALSGGAFEDYLEADKQFVQSEQLFPLIEELLKRNSLDYKDLNVIACSLGPGSFTGVRIGIAAARGINKVFQNIKLLGVSTLELMVSELQLPVAEKKLLAVLGASGGDLYAQDFNSNGIALGQIYLLPQKDLESLDAMLITDKASFSHARGFAVNLTALSVLNRIKQIIAEGKEEAYQNFWPIYTKEPNITRTNGLQS